MRLRALPAVRHVKARAEAEAEAEAEVKISGILT